MIILMADVLFSLGRIAFGREKTQVPMARFPIFSFPIRRKIIPSGRMDHSSTSKTFSGNLTA
jgi:hypothetical protein